MTDENMKRYLAAWDRAYNKGDAKAFDPLLAPGYVRHFSLSPDLGGMDRAALQSSISLVRNAFPDIQSRIEAVVGDDQEFALRWSSSGTHRAPFLGLPATGRTIRTGGMTFCRFAGDQLAKEWVAWDVREALDALGIFELRLPSRWTDDDNVPKSDLIRAVHRKFATGVTIVTAADEEGLPRGLAVNAFMSVSLEPPVILVSVAQSSRTHALLVSGDAFAVNILADDQANIVKTFASSAEDKFAGISWRRGASGAPIIDGVAGWFEAVTIQYVQAFTHTFIVGKVTDAGMSDVDPIIYSGGQLFSQKTSAEIRPAD